MIGATIPGMSDTVLWIVILASLVAVALLLWALHTGWRRLCRRSRVARRVDSVASWIDAWISS